jgi:Uma2 family endonuclease
VLALPLLEGRLERERVMSSQKTVVGLHYLVPRHPAAGWELSEETVPESVVHDQAVSLLRALLAAWAARTAAMVVRNLAVRWDKERPAIGVDPDVALLRPPPPDATNLRSVRTWLPGHASPLLAVEVVSETNPHKDYAIAPEKYAASGVGELWIFDPLLAGPTAYGGPWRLQVWQRREDGDFVRIYAGDGPTRSPFLGAWLVPTDEGRKLRVAEDEGVTQFWLTPEEAEREAKDAALAAAKAERAAKEAALARVAELEAELRRRRG